MYTCMYVCIYTCILYTITIMSLKYLIKNAACFSLNNVNVINNRKLIKKAKSKQTSDN